MTSGRGRRGGIALPHRIAGDIALDLCNTFSFRDTPDEVDHLRDADGLLAWARAGELVGAGFAPTAAEQDRLVADLHDLRGAIERAGHSLVEGRAPPAETLARIRDHAARGLASATVSGIPPRLAFVADPIVGRLAFAALDLLRGDELGRLKRCPQPDCRWFFIDRSKNGSRQWCDMASCGDRAKQSRRRRGRAEPSPE